MAKVKASAKSKEPKQSPKPTGNIEASAESNQAPKSEGSLDTPSTGSDYHPKVLIVDHGSAYTEHLKDMYRNKPGVTYDITVSTDEAIRKLKASDKKGEALKEYDIIHASGSRRKKNLNDEATRYILDNAGEDTHIVNTCYSAEVLATHQGADVKRLQKYQKGKQKIEFHSGEREGQDAYIHKAHQWGIPVTEGSKSKLETIASSEQVLEDGTKIRINEIFRSKNNPRHIGVQGHGEQGVGKELMYELLDEIHATGYKTK